MEIASSAIGFFNFAVDCFGRIQLAREFETGFEIYQLKLDVLQIRLSRWGVVAGITHNNGPNVKAIEGKQAGGEPFPLESPEGILQTIKKTLDKAQRKGKPVPGNDPLDPELYVPEDLKGIRARFKECLRKRIAQAGATFESVKWAFYKKEEFERFIADISALIDALEALFSEDLQQKLRELSKEECQGIDKPDLEELKGIVKDFDPWLEGAVGEQEKVVPGGSTYNTITQSHITGVANGIMHGDMKGISIGTGITTNNECH